MIFLVSNWDCTLPHNIDSSIALESLKISQRQPITNVSQIEKKLETMIVKEEEKCKGCFFIHPHCNTTTTNRRIFVRYTYSNNGNNTTSHHYNLVAYFHTPTFHL
jgi:hypothetical protein